MTFERRRFLSIPAALLAGALLAALGAGCGGGASSAGPAAGGEVRVGIMTGTVSQGEDEYRGAEAVVARYGKDAVTHVTYPDNFMTESETTISLLKGLADDPDVKAIVVAQAVPGTVPAIKKIRKDRPDLVFILNTPHEDPDQVPKYADLALNPDELRRGDTVVAVARRLGAKHFVHYSFPRHMSQPLLAQRRDIMRAACEREGLSFDAVNAPDPMGDQGLPGAQKFILEDVPREVAKLGKDTAFFSTNCGAQEPLIRAALEAGAIVPEQCCPSPTHGYPGALGLAVSEADAGDMAKIRARLSEKIAEKGGKGRFATWPVSINVVMIEASTALALEVGKGALSREKLRDAAVVRAALEKAAGGKVDIRPLEGTDNYLMVIAESIVF
jgi:hypothetical protein